MIMATTTSWMALGLLVSLAWGFEIQFTPSLTTIQPLLTESLRLRCALYNPLSAAGAEAESEITQTTKPLAHVTSIVVLRGTTHVATVSQFQGAQALVDTAQLQVRGNVTGVSDQDAFLELVWTYPDAQQRGTYRCEINAVDEFSHNVLLNKSVAIASRNPRIEDVVKEERKKMEALQRYDAVLELFNQFSSSAATLESVNARYEQVRNELADLQSRLTQVSNNFTDVRADYSQVVNTLKQLKDQFEKVWNV